MNKQEAEQYAFEIIPLPREKWQGTPIPMRYTTKEYYCNLTE